MTIIKESNYFKNAEEDVEKKDPLFAVVNLYNH